MKTFTNQSNFETYGLWNNLAVYDRSGDKNELLAAIPAHDGDFFPESPLDYVEALRNAGSDLASLWPVRVDIDINQACTSDCYFCYSRQYARDPEYHNAAIDPGLFETLLDQLQEGGTRTIRFTGGGEPLVHKDIRKMLPLPREKGLYSCLITNGDLLVPELSRFCVQTIDHLRVSVNAATQEVRNKTHGASGFPHSIDTIFQNLKEMVRAREQLHPGERRPSIWATFLVLPENYSEIYAITRIMKDIGVDSISFRPLYHDLAKKLGAEEFAAIAKEFEKARELEERPRFLVFTPKRDVARVWDVNPRENFPHCLSNRLRTVLESTNNGLYVKICGLHRGAKGIVLGKQDSSERFEQLWYSPGVVNLCRTIPEACGRCIDISMNVALNKIFDILQKNPDAVFEKVYIS
ncbi:MAG: radical SAM protein [bacterium]|nr:radical SAM protein [bacterium]